jgi:hypothetical protein
MKSQVAWARPRLDLHPRLFGWTQLSASCVKTKNHDLVCTQIARVREPVRLIKHKAMRVRTLLTLLVYARTMGLLHIDRRAQTAVALCGQYHDVASNVIGYQNELGNRIDVDVTRCATQ